MLNRRALLEVNYTILYGFCVKNPVAKEIDAKDT
jgi:hypothetical protein